MKPTLRAAAADMYSQFGEDGVVEHIFGLIGDGQRVCVEFGAGDGYSCSNTAALWSERGWRAVLIEADPDRYRQLRENVTDRATAIRRFVAPTGHSSIDVLLGVQGVDHVDYMSVDVDGADYHILEAMTVRPRVVSVEFNPTIPPHIDIRQATPDQGFGASLLAFIRLAPRLGYRFVGATYCNAFLVLEDEASPFDEYETDPTVLFPPELYSYLVTDFTGRTVRVGAPLPWGPGLPLTGRLTGDPAWPVTDDVDAITRGFQADYGPATVIPADQLHPDVVAEALSRGGLVCVDLSQCPTITEAQWIFDYAAATGNYRAVLTGGVLGLVPESG